MYANAIMKLDDFYIQKADRELEEISAFISDFVTNEDSILSCGIKNVFIKILPFAKRATAAAATPAKTPEVSTLAATESSDEAKTDKRKSSYNQNRRKKLPKHILISSLQLTRLKVQRR